MSFPDDMKSIKKKIKETVEGAVLSESINSAIIGAKARLSSFRPPLIWVFFDTGNNDEETWCSTEDWTVSFKVIGIVEGHDSEEEADRADALALSASRALLADRTLGGLVNDVKRTSFLFGDRLIETNNLLYASTMTMELKLTVTEV